MNINSFKLGGQVNAGSMQIGSDGTKLTSGLSLDLGLVGVGVFDNAYKINAYYDAKESGYKVYVPLWSEEHKTTTIYDSRGRLYNKLSQQEQVKTETGEIEMSAVFIIGGEVKINLENLKHFVIELFKPSDDETKLEDQD